MANKDFDPFYFWNQPSKVEVVLKALGALPDDALSAPSSQRPQFPHENSIEK